MSGDSENATAESASHTAVPTDADGKAVWRTWAKTERARLPIAEISAAVVAHLGRRLGGNEARTVLFYLPFGSEIDLRPLPTLTSRTKQHRFAVTRTPDSRPLARGELAEPLTIHPLDSEMERHRYGMMQPVEDASHVPFGDVDIVLVPGLAFDVRGTRLGFGAGYFDRLLPHMPQACAIGIVPEALVVDRLPHETHDQPMLELATEQGVRPIATRTMR